MDLVEFGGGGGGLQDLILGTVIGLVMEGWRLAGVCPCYRWLHRSWRWLEVEIPSTVALIFRVVAIIRLAAALWERIVGCGCLFGSIRV